MENEILKNTHLREKTRVNRWFDITKFSSYKLGVRGIEGLFSPEGRTILQAE